MIAIIRIRGQVKIKSDMGETLDRLKLRKKFTCIVLDNPNTIQLGMLEKIKDYVAFGNINQETYNELVKKRGKQGTNFFRLHPPRGGIESKKHYGIGKGVLGDNKEKINDLIKRML